MTNTWRQRAKQLKTETYALYLAYKDPRVKWHARAFAACVVGYAFSPIDLIPDPIPVALTSGSTTNERSNPSEPCCSRAPTPTSRSPLRATTKRVGGSINPSRGRPAWVSSTRMAGRSASDPTSRVITRNKVADRR